MKKLFAILVAVALCLSMIPMAAMAADVAYTVAGDQALCGTNWDASNTANDMTDADGDGVYEKLYSNVAPGTYSFKILKDHDWGTAGENNWPVDNKTFTVETACDVTVVFDANSKEVSVRGSGLGGLKIEAIYVAGNGNADNAAWLNGQEWAADAKSNKMTNNNGVYTITYNDVPRGSYECKFTVNGGWSISFGGTFEASGVKTVTGGSNIAFSVDYDLADVTLELDMSKYDTVNLTGETTFTVTIADAAAPEVTEPEATQPEATEPEATQPEATEPEATQPEATEPEATQPEATQPEATQPEVTEPEATQPEAPAVNAGDVVVAGSDTLCGSNWNAGDGNNLMTGAADGIYEKIYTGVAAGSYQFKVVVKGGAEDGSDLWVGDATGNNVAFNVTDTCDVKVTYHSATGEVTVTGDKVSFTTELVVDSMAAVGNGKEGWLNGESWNPAAESNKMTETSDGVYEITFENVPAGTAYEVKFAANGGWNDSFGGVFGESGVAADAEYNGGNIAFDVTYGLANVALKLDLTNFDYATKTGAVYTLTITDVTPEDYVPEVTEPAQSDPESTEAAPLTEITVYAKVPEDWVEPRVWAWDDNQQNAATTPWPGELVMTKGENGWWSCKVPVWIENVIINANSGTTQTIDLDVAETEKDIWVEITDMDGTGKYNAVLRYSSPKTGDMTFAAEAAALMLIAVTAMAVLVLGRKKFFN